MRRMAIILLLIIGCASRAYPEGSESEIKAVFLFNFFRYVDFPHSGSSNRQLRIAVLGRSEIFDALIEVSEKKKIEGQAVVVVPVSENESVPCDILFIPETELKNLESTAKLYRGKGVLIVTENCHHTERGAAINLITVDNKIRFQINQTSAKNGGVRISSQLSSLAMIVYP